MPLIVIMPTDHLQELEATVGATKNTAGPDDAAAALQFLNLEFESITTGRFSTLNSDSDTVSLDRELSSEHQSGETSSSDPDAQQKHILLRPSILKTAHSSVSVSDAPQAGSRPKKAIRRSVSFDSITIREYDLTLGDHPCCSYGPPLMLDWNYVGENSIDVEEYEGNRPDRRTLRGMLMNYYHRRDLLMGQYGHSEEEIKKGTRDMNRTKTQRTVTKCFLPIMKVEDVITSVGRKTQRAVLKKKKERRSSEKEFLALYA